MFAIGVDIGGTKCAVSLGEIGADSVTVVHKCAVRETGRCTPLQMLERLSEDILFCKSQCPGRVEGIGISCGGPLDSKTGVILSPPNLPGWDRIAITDFFRERTGLPAYLCNDANACALAEWKLGAGRGYSNVIFLTFGTGLGAGLILNGRLYCGASDMAGEAGHVRLSEFGPSGYGKMGSFEGFCSGGGIAQLAAAMVRERLQAGERPSLCGSAEELEDLTAAKVGIAAKNGDPLAREVLRVVGVQLGKGLSLLMDILNPECIILGSIFVRSYHEIWPHAQAVIEREALPAVRAACSVLPSRLAESVGDVAALTAAAYYIGMENER